MKRFNFKIFSFFLIYACFSQDDEKWVYYGNKLMRMKQYGQAALLFEKALKENPQNTAARFNLGNALYRQAQELLKDTSGKIQVPGNIPRDSAARMMLDQALSYYDPITQRISNRDTLQKTWHNIGNSHLWKKDYDRAIEAYKKALKLNPKDEYTRYNLAYALAHRKNQQQGGGGSSSQSQQPKENEMNKEEADRLLKAIMQAEQKLHDKDKHKKEANQSKPEKDW